MENGLAVNVEVDVVEIVVVGDVDMNVVLTGLIELVAALVTELLVVTGLVLLEVDVSAVAEVTRLKSKPKSEGTELVSSGSSESVVGLLVVVLPPSGATMSGLIGISKGMVIRAMLGAVTVGKVTLGKVTLPSILDDCVPSWSAAIVVSLTSSTSLSEPLVSPETMDRSKKFEDLGRSLKKLGSVTRVVEDASDVTNSESIETTKGLGDRVGWVKKLGSVILVVSLAPLFSVILPKLSETSLATLAAGLKGVASKLISPELDVLAKEEIATNEGRVTLLVSPNDSELFCSIVSTGTDTNPGKVILVVGSVKVSEASLAKRVVKID